MRAVLGSALPPIMLGQSIAVFEKPMQGAT